VAADSHVDVPRDNRSLEELLLEDMVPFERLAQAGLAGVMPAHVVFSRVDALPPGFSARWLQEILRRRLGFQGIIFSDDLSMAGARVAGGLEESAEQALAAGCDMVLVCNDRPGAVRVVHHLARYEDPAAHLRLVRLHGRHAPDWEALHQSAPWQQAVTAIEAIDPPAELALR